MTSISLKGPLLLSAAQTPVATASWPAERCIRLRKLRSSSCLSARVRSNHLIRRIVEYMSINFSGGKSFAQYPISPSAQAILLLRDTAAPAAADPFKRVRRVVDADDVESATQRVN